MRFEPTTYVKTLLGTVASLFLAVIIPSFVMVYPSISGEKATGLAAVAGGLMESALSPWFWISFVFFLTAFHVTGNLENKAFRVLLFWIPTVLTSIVGFGLWALFLYMARLARPSPAGP